MATYKAQGAALGRILATFCGVKSAIPMGKEKHYVLLEPELLCEVAPHPHFQSHSRLGGLSQRLCLQLQMTVEAAFHRDSDSCKT